MLTRRAFATSSLAALAFGGLSNRSLAEQTGDDTYRNQVHGYGDLAADPAGLLDLPRGFSYRVISSAGEAMDDGYVTPDHFDGMACFGLGGSRVALVRNHELSVSRFDFGPTGGRARLVERLRGEPHFGRDNEGRPLAGGTSTLVCDLASGRRETQYLSLAGTLVNCAGGPTPWGSWLSCEENVSRAGEVGQDHGWVFDVPARGRGLVRPIALRGLGRMRHEAAAVDPATGIVYLTEDQDDSLFYRFVPETPGRLEGPGRLQALALRDISGADARNWEGIVVPPGSRHAVRWIDLDEPESPQDDLRQRGHAAGAALFARGEGIHHGSGEFFFCCTSGGAAELGQIFRYRPGAREGQPDEAGAPGELQLFVESSDPKVMDYADNVTVAPWGHLVVCEDRADGVPCHLKGVTPEGRLYTIARLRLDTELAGACFSPDGGTLFVNAYRPGRTLAITGPWNAVRSS
ncbi:alkaline phosphatase PhoX [Sphingosinicella terrae]|uniref:alkaline phosphatase PhoX n=1 Tax=Sphingosinicella terrae TaxID=2172047 RepID=UPI000E0DE213|nr:alkaline phosphatase PhoX [Sphingosinicella terrae]